MRSIVSKPSAPSFAPPGLSRCQRRSSCGFRSRSPGTQVSSRLGRTASSSSSEASSPQSSAWRSTRPSEHAPQIRSKLDTWATVFAARPELVLLFVVPTESRLAWLRRNAGPGRRPALEGRSFGGRGRRSRLRRVRSSCRTRRLARRTRAPGRAHRRASVTTVRHSSRLRCLGGAARLRRRRGRRPSAVRFRRRGRGSEARCAMTPRLAEIIAAMVYASLQGREGQDAEAAVPSPASPGSVSGFGREEMIEHEPRAHRRPAGRRSQRQDLGGLHPRVDTRPGGPIRPRDPARRAGDVRRAPRAAPDAARVRRSRVGQGHAPADRLRPDARGR